MSLGATLITGFFSPKFEQKTGLTAKDVYAFIDQQSADVIGFSPFFGVSATCINIFDQCEVAHPGIHEALTSSVKALNLPESILSSVMTQRESIFCNFFVAKKEFWKIWFEMAEHLFHIAETSKSPLAEKLNAPVPYLSELLPAKVFVIERLVGMLLGSRQEYTVACYPVRLKNPDPRSFESSFQTEILVLDSLKRSFQATGRVEYLTAYSGFRDTLVKKVEKIWLQRQSHV